MAELWPATPVRYCGTLYSASGTAGCWSEVKQTIVNGVLKESNGRSIAELERERDGILLELLATRSKGEKAARARTNAAAG
jgi:hypothetical protein